MQCRFQRRLVYLTWGDVRKMSPWLYTRPMFEVLNVILIHAPLWELPILSASDAIMESNRLNLESEGAPSHSGSLEPTQTLASLPSQSPVIQKGKSANCSEPQRRWALQCSWSKTFQRFGAVQWQVAQQPSEDISGVLSCRWPRDAPRGLRKMLNVLTRSVDNWALPKYVGWCHTWEEQFQFTEVLWVFCCCLFVFWFCDKAHILTHTNLNYLLDYSDTLICISGHSDSTIIDNEL